MKTLMKLAMVTTALMTISSVVQAKETVVWWDFLGGGDGVRMKALIDEFNKENGDNIEIQATTLEWGTPFYTKAQTSAAVGEGPDVMTYHISRLPLGVSTNTLSEITADDLASVGLKAEDYAPANWQAAQVDGKQYAIPFDIHSIILYYNKDKLKAAGLLGDDGLPKGLDGVDNFKAALQKLKDGGSQYGVSIHSAAGDSQWRIFYSLLNQQDGKFFADGKFLDGDNLDKAVKATQVVADWVKEGLAPSNTEYPASIALFTSGEAAMHINGVWEVPTFTDLAAKGQLGFEWGAVALPTFFDHPATWADSHSFVIPNNVGKDMTPEKRKAVMEVIAWMNKHSLAWAGAGHIPAYGPVRDSAEFKALQPNATYSVLADTAAFDPVSTLAGVASPVYDAAGNYMVPAINGEMDPQQAIEDLRDDLQAQVE
ncbi:ABC transporter substrate-binding protein [Youhaiella tibetensis]|uniref:ABC transporter substrate-binding protein n=1 Tax=Paradevosia tibetensis TaxID=1447062 RepID=A0A5B9DLX2_9HYPH|nr:ABC transporter substrate-binding protein [Youhaiella tibetensis]AKR54815.1 sugar ABC transporter substrate-binding protein [Devosia sp. H5989]QEE19932.1 ABC transporter substrate-binding protein [Youhaiella tibetensis]GGF28563.1 ABC transporter substrate-binding protein [Youhaiella tibetensis]